MTNKNTLTHRKKNSNKDDYGHVFVLAGSVGFTGAAVLTASAAMRTGAGLATIGIPESLNTIVAKRVLEVMTKPLPETKDKTISLNAYKGIAAFSQKADVLAIGPGLSRNPSTQKLIRKIVSKIKLPMVIDADGINALCGHLDVLTPNPQHLTPILTPHPGEFSRLTGKTVSYIQKHRETLAKSFSSDYNIILILKGNKTVIAEPGGKIYINKTGNPGMAAAGAGDVLTGMVAALLGQGFSAFKAAKLGVYLHGMAGDLAAKEKTQAGLIASDIIEKIPDAIKKL